MKRWVAWKNESELQDTFEDSGTYPSPDDRSGIGNKEVLGHRLQMSFQSTICVLDSHVKKSKCGVYSWF